MFVRVHLPIGQPHPALLVIDRAIRSDQGLKYVYTVDKDNMIQQKTVQTGALEPDGLRVIEPTGKPGDLTINDWVVVGGILQVKPKTLIKRDEEPMPTLGSSIDGESSTSTGDFTSPAQRQVRPRARQRDPRLRPRRKLLPKKQNKAHRPRRIQMPANPTSHPPRKATADRRPS